MIRQRTVLAASMFALVLASVTGCSAAEAPGESVAPSEEVSASGETQPSETPVVEPTTAFAADDPACLAGTWTLDQAGMDAFYDQIEQGMLAQGISATFTPVGSALLEVDNAGTYSWSPTTTVVMDLSGVEMEVTLGGTLSGTYTAAPGSIRTDPEVDDRLEVSATMGGQAVDPTVITDEISASPLADSRFICSDRTLELSTVVAATPVTSTLYR